MPGGHLFLLPPVILTKMSWSCSSPGVAGIQVRSTSAGSIAAMPAIKRLRISCINSSCMGLRSGWPKNVRASSGVQSMFMVIFIALLVDSAEQKVQTKESAADKCAKYSAVEANAFRGRSYLHPERMFSVAGSQPVMTSATETLIAGPDLADEPGLG